MAFVALDTGDTLNLNTAAYNYGYFNDTILMIGAGDFTIRTYEGNDVIDFRRMQSVSSLSDVFSGSGNDKVYGSASVERVRDGSGNDVIALGGGHDVVYVGSGNDIYDGGSGHDTLDFTSVTEDGLVQVGDNYNPVTVDLAITTAQNLGAFGTDIVKNFEYVYGGHGGDTLRGNALSNVLNGHEGNDRLEGRDGSDQLEGQSGSDILIGGKGQDSYYCGLNDNARDVVRFTSFNDAGPDPSAADFVYEFDFGGGATDDKIDLSALDGNAAVAGNQAFVWRGAGAFGTTAVCEVRKVADGANVIVQIDTDSDAAPEMTVHIDGVTVNQLTLADFIL